MVSINVSNIVQMSLSCSCSQNIKYNIYVYGTYVVSINISTFVFLVCILSINICSAQYYCSHGHGMMQQI